MTLRFHLQVAGLLLLTLGVAHVRFDRYFGWKRELSSVSLLTRQVFTVHCFFISLVLVMLGLCSVFFTDAMLEPNALSRLLLVGIVVFWLCRLFVQVFVYDRMIWRGRRFYTLMHVVFCIMWLYFIITYGAALARISHELTAHG